MNQPTNHSKQSTVCLLAIAMTLLGQAAPTGVNAITHSREDEPRANEIAPSYASASPLAPANAARQFKAAEAYGRVPLGFEANTGQISDDRVKFLARGDAYNLFLASTEATFAFFKTQRAGPPSGNKKNPGSMRERIGSQSPVENNQSAPLRISMRGANGSATPKGADELPGRNNYFIGSDPATWRVNVPTYSRVEYEGIYRGVDLVYHGELKQLEYDFIVAPGASYKDIRIGFEGGDRISLDDLGDLVIEIGGEKVYQRKPVAYQKVDGIQQAIAVRYVLSTHGDIGFEIGAYDARRSLVIDPVLSYSTYLGIAPINGVAVDQTGNAYVTGTFPLAGIFSSVSDAFVIKLNREGTAVLYSTFLGGSDRMVTAGIQNQAFGIAVDSNGIAYVTGSTDSKDFPTTAGAFQTTLPGTQKGRSSAFVTKLSSTGDALVYSTYLGGTDNFSQSSAQAIAVDGAGSAYVTGFTNSLKFPLVNPIQSINRGGNCFRGDVIVPCQNEAFVTKLNASGSALVYSTILGGSGDDSGSGVAIDKAGFAYVVGTTAAYGFPTRNPLQSARGGSTDIFIAKLSVAGDELIYSSLLGGSASETANGIAVDSSGNAYVTGRTSSTDFPTTAASFQPSNAIRTAFKSTDGATTWNAIDHGLPGTDSSVRQLVVDPINSSTLYANTADGLFKSTDGGNSWGYLIGGISALSIDPTNPSTLYASIIEIPCCILMRKSTDGGKTWFAPPPLFFLPLSLATSILIDPKDPPRCMLLRSSNKSVRRSGYLKALPVEPLGFRQQEVYLRYRWPRLPWPQRNRKDSMLSPPVRYSSQLMAEESGSQAAFQATSPQAVWRLIRFTRIPSTLGLRSVFPRALTERKPGRIRRFTKTSACSLLIRKTRQPFMQLAEKSPTLIETSRAPMAVKAGKQWVESQGISWPLLRLIRTTHRLFMPGTSYRAGMPSSRRSILRARLSSTQRIWVEQMTTSSEPLWLMRRATLISRVGPLPTISRSRVLSNRTSAVLLAAMMPSLQSSILPVI